MAGFLHRNDAAGMVRWLKNPHVAQSIKAHKNTVQDNNTFLKQGKAAHWIPIQKVTWILICPCFEHGASGVGHSLCCGTSLMLVDLSKLHWEESDGEQ